MSQVDQDMAAAVGAVVRKYARRCWWADESDIRQEAWLYAHKVRGKFDPALSRTGDIKPLIRIAVSRNVQRLLLKDSAPVSASDHHRHELRGLTRAPVEALEVTGQHAAPETPERLLILERWRAQVTVRLREVAGADTVEAVFDVLDRGKKPTRAALEAMAIMRGDEALKRLWEER